jgi:hypothetical protein
MKTKKYMRYFNGALMLAIIVMLTSCGKGNDSKPVPKEKTPSELLAGEWTIKSMRYMYDLRIPKDSTIINVALTEDTKVNHLAFKLGAQGSPNTWEWTYRPDAKDSGIWTLDTDQTLLMTTNGGGIVGMYFRKVDETTLIVAISASDYNGVTYTWLEETYSRDK